MLCRLRCVYVGGRLTRKFTCLCRLCVFGSLTTLVLVCLLGGVVPAQSGQMRVGTMTCFCFVFLSLFLQLCPVSGMPAVTALIYYIKYAPGLF